MPATPSTDELVATLSRRPQTAEDLAAIFGEEVRDVLDRLVDSGILYKEEFAGIEYYKVHLL